jgi:large subunit ribosomal protein L10
MAKTKAQKGELLKEYADILKNNKGLMVLRSTGLNPNQLSAIKKELYDFGSSFKVVKNKVFKLALKESSLDDSLITSGEHSVVYFGEDLVSPAKAIKKFIEDTKVDKEFRVQFVGGVLDGVNLTKEQTIELAEMPTKQQSIGLILGILDNAMSSVINVLEDPIKGYASILDQAFKA